MQYSPPPRAMGLLFRLITHVCGFVIAKVESLVGPNTLFLLYKLSKKSCIKQLQRRECLSANFQQA